MTVIAPDRPLELLVGWKQTVTVQNISNKSLTLKTLQWLIPPQLAATRATTKKNPGAPTATPTATPIAETVATELAGRDWDVNVLKDEPTLAAGQVAVYQLSMPSTSDSGEWWMFNPTILTWHYRELVIPVLLTYKTSGDDGVAGSLTENMKVQWQTPFRTMVIGGILGALLAMSFYYVYLRLSVASKYFADRKVESVPLDVTQAKQEISNILTGLRIALEVTAPEHRDIAWRQMLTASVTVIIVLLLLASGNQNILPVTITVADFTGAAFLGLIAHKIGKVTFDAIFGEKSLPSSSPVATAPVLNGEWDATTHQGRLTWTERRDLTSTKYVIRKLATITGDPANGMTIREFKPGDKFELFVSEGLQKAGDEAIFVLIVKQADGKELVSKPITIRRP